MPSQVQGGADDANKVDVQTAVWAQILARLHCWLATCRRYLKSQNTLIPNSCKDPPRSHGNIFAARMSSPPQQLCRGGFSSSTQKGRCKCQVCPSRSPFETRVTGVPVSCGDPWDGVCCRCRLGNGVLVNFALPCLELARPASHLRLNAMSLVATSSCFSIRDDYAQETSL